MKLKVNVSLKWGDFARIEQIIVPKLVAGAGVGAQAVLAESQLRVPVDTGALRASAATSVEWVGKKVTGYVQYAQPYAGYVEFGTGIRGQSSAGAGPYPYNPKWPGQVAQPYLRPALDSSRDAVLAAFKEALGTTV